MTPIEADAGHIRIEDRDGRLFIRWFCDDSSLWFRVLDDFKAAFPTHADKTYNATAKAWTVPGWHRNRLVEWADVWFTSSAQEWADADAYSDNRGQSSRTHSGREQYARYSNSEIVTLADAYKVLHLRPTAPPEVVAAAHRAMVRLTHPDAGGSHEAAVTVNRAIEVIRQHQAQRTV